MKIFDRFKKRKLSNYRSMWSSTQPFIAINSDWNTSRNEKEDKRLEGKPVEVWEQLKTIPADLDFSNLDQKITVIKKRIKVIEDNMKDIPSDEYEVLGYLEARKKYKQNINLFQWPITTDEMVKDLCAKYKLKTARFEEYYTLIPEEGINEIGKYRHACRQIRKENPVFSLIIPDKKEEPLSRHRDPILFSSSPFGRWNYILGAWDKEVAIVDDFIYNYK